MTSQRCDRCRAVPAPVLTTSGQRLCQACYRRLASVTGAAIALAEGQGVGTAIVDGIAAGGFADAVAGEAAAARRRRAKLAATTGFWRRIWVRVIG
jgi:hypothetical protein